jgi:small subunit ribosomal protein S7
MSRAKGAARRSVQPDLKYGSVVVAKLINRSMRDGKKSVAQKQIYNALGILSETLKRDAMEALDEVIRKVAPQMEVRSRRVGGASYQVPTPVRQDRAFSLAVRWLVIEANKRPNKTYHSFADKLAAEMLDALNEEGGAYAKRMSTHRMADANKAVAHFRW